MHKNWSRNIHYGLDFFEALNCADDDLVESSEKVWRICPG